MCVCNQLSTRLFVSKGVSLQLCEAKWEYFVRERKLEYLNTLGYLNTLLKHFVPLLQTLNGIESPITYPSRPCETKKIQLRLKMKVLVN